MGEARLQVWAFAFALLPFALLAAGCRQDMHDQPKYRPLRASDFFADGQASRPLVAGTVARGNLRENRQFFTGKVASAPSSQPSVEPQMSATTTSAASGVPPSSAAGPQQQLRSYVTRFPFSITLETLDRGQDRFDAFCTPCHDRVGTGQGMVVRRGYRRPPSFHIERLRQAPVGYIFDVITNGLGAMPDYAAQIPPRDRWAIIAYIRALQLSQQTSVTDLPPQERNNVDSGGAPK